LGHADKASALDYFMPAASETGEITMEYSLPLLAIATSAARLRHGWRGVDSVQKI
jgi:hypothetical protein